MARRGGGEKRGRLRQGRSSTDELLFPLRRRNEMAFLLWKVRERCQGRKKKPSRGEEEKTYRTNEKTRVQRDRKGRDETCDACDPRCFEGEKVVKIERRRNDGSTEMRKRWWKGDF